MNLINKIKVYLTPTYRPFNDALNTPRPRTYNDAVNDLRAALTEAGYEDDQ